mgnify:CR=1 FL=1
MKDGKDNMNKGGRQTIYSDELADRLFEQLAEGKSLRKVCEAEDMPCCRTVFNWMRNKEGFMQQYEAAKEECADHYADEIVDIADNDAFDIDEEGKVRTEHIQRSRLRVDARKWVAVKLKPKKYGDKTTVSGDPESPLMIHKIERVIVGGNTPDQDS